MAEIPYARRPLARPGGGGGGGLVSTPRLPDVSGGARALAGLGQEFTDIAEDLGRLVAAQRKAQDAAALAGAEASLNERLGLAYNEIVTDQRLDPWEYGARMQARRDEIVGELGQDLPGRLSGAWQGKAGKASDALIIKADYLGKTQGRERALTTLDTLTDQLTRQQNQATDPQERQILDARLRETYGSYVESGILAPQEAEQRLQKHRDTQSINRWQAQIRLDPEASVKQLEQGPGANPDVPPDAYPKLVDEARRVRTSHLEYQEALDRRAERELRDAQAVRSSQLRDAILNGQAGSAEVSRARANREISEGDHAELINFNLSLQRHREAAAEHRARLGEMQSERADRSALGRIQADYEAGKISGQDVMRLATSGKWTGRVSGEAARWVGEQERQLNNKAKTDLRQRHDEMLSESRAAFEREGLNPRTNEMVDQVWAEYRRDVRERSKAWSDSGNAKDPFELMDEYLPRFLNQAKAGLKRRNDVLIGTLPESYKPQAGVDIREPVQRLQQDYQAGRLGEEDYRSYTRRLREIETGDNGGVYRTKPPAPAPAPRPETSGGVSGWLRRRFEPGPQETPAP